MLELRLSLISSANCSITVAIELEGPGIHLQTHPFPHTRLNNQTGSRATKGLSVLFKFCKLKEYND